MGQEAFSSRERAASCPGPARPPDLPARLRHATAGRHARLHRHPLLAGITGAYYDLHTYRRVLGAFVPLYEVLEERLGRALARHAPAFDFAARRKLPWLHADQAYFHDVPADLGSHGLDLGTRGPAVDSLAEAVGLLYVVEGSTLGGQLIARALAARHGLDAAHGARFFNGYGEATAAQWAGFLQLAGEVPDAEGPGQAEAAAGEGFQLVEEVLDTCLRSAPRNRVRR